MDSLPRGQVRSFRVLAWLTPSYRYRLLAVLPGRQNANLRWILLGTVWLAVQQLAVGPLALLPSEPKAREDCDVPRWLLPQGEIIETSHGVDWGVQPILWVARNLETNLTDFALLEKSCPRVGFVLTTSVASNAVKHRQGRRERLGTPMEMFLISHAALVISGAGKASK